MRRVTKRLIALLLCVSMMLSMVTSISADTRQDDVSTGLSGFSWEETNEVLSATITSEEVASDEEETEVDPETEVRVAIVFEEDSAIEAGYSTTDIALNEEAMAYMDTLAGSQEEILEVIADEVYDGEALETRNSFTLTTNAVTATIAYGEIEAIEAVDGVSSVYVQTQYEVQADTQTTTAADMISSVQTWAAGYTGAGMKIAIIDTGLDIDHQSFAEDSYLYSLSLLDDDSYTETWLTKEQIEAVLPSLNAYETYYEATGEYLTVDDVYCSAKIPFGYNYVDETLDVTHDNDSQGDHGTHVAGIAAANTYINVDGEYVKAAEDSSAQAVGVAPDAQVMNMKVFGMNGGAFSEDYVSAIEDAIMLGANSVNLSIGECCAGMVTSNDEWEQSIFAWLSETDTVVTVSGGNNYYWSYYSSYGLNLTDDTSIATVSSPGSYTNSLSVASADNTGSTGYTFNAEGVEVFYTDNASSYGHYAFTTLDTSADGSGTEYEYVVLVPCGDGWGFGYEEDMEALDAALKADGDEDGLTGKIVIMERGTLIFDEKAENAAGAGAAGIVIYNNTSGTFSIGFSDYGYFTPVVSILQSDGEEIIANSEKHDYVAAYADEEDETIVETIETSYYTGTMTVYSNIVLESSDDPKAATMSTFSSWGAPGDLSISPEITAPGGSIWSTLDDGSYGIMSGTSMAAPGTAGMAALVIQHIYENEALSALTESGENTVRALAQSLLMGTATPLIDEESGAEYSVRQQGSGLADVLSAVTSTALVTVDGQEDGKVKAELGDDADREGVYSFTFHVTNFGDETVSYDLDSSVLTADVVSDGYYEYMSTSDTALDSVTSFELEAGHLIYDLNGDDVVDELDALLVLQYADDKDTLTAEQLELADLDGDGDVDTRDAYLWLLDIEAGTGVATAATVSLTDGTLSVEPGITATVTVTISLTDEGRAWLEEYYANGGYVEGYIYLNASAGDNEEGAIVAVDQSIPFLAYYGNWADPSMYEVNEFIEMWYAEEYDANYAADLYTNYFTLSSGGSEVYFISNIYADDDEYIADRNALNSEEGDSIYSVAYSLIRNAADVAVVIRDADTDEIYYEFALGSQCAEYYDEDYGEWSSTWSSAIIDWAGTDADGNALPDGTNVTISLAAVTEYTDEDGNYVTGDGSYLTLPLTIDNTSPSGSGKLNENGEMLVTVSDNQYVAAVQLYDADDQYIETLAVNQTEAGSTSEVNLGDLTEYTAMQETSIYTIVVVDYAGNSTSYRVKLDDSEEYSDEAAEIVLSRDEINILEGIAMTITARVLPLNAEDRSVTWSSADTSIATVTQNGIVTAVSEGTTTITATSNQTPSVTATCVVNILSVNKDLNALYWDADGYVYEALINTGDLSTYQEVLDLGDMQFVSQALVGDTLYAATYSPDGYSDIYTLDIETGETQYISTTSWMTDMAYGETTGLLYGTCGCSLNIWDPETGNSFDIVSPSSVFDYDQMAGISCLFSSGDSDYFAVMTESGCLYMLAVGYEDGALVTGITELSSGSLGVSSTWYFSSMYYYWNEETGEEFIFLSSYDDGDNQYLYVITYDENSGYFDTCYEAGGFNDGVWPVSGLCQLDNETSESAGSAVSSLAESITMEKTTVITTEDESAESTTTAADEEATTAATSDEEATTAAASDADGSTTASSGGSDADTGDRSVTMLWIMMFLALGSVTVLAVKSRKKNM